MAPITVTTQAVDRQVIDDPQLVELLRRLSSYDTTREEHNSSQVKGYKDDTRQHAQMKRHVQGKPQAMTIDVEGLVGELERWPVWKFQEMVSTQPAT